MNKIFLALTIESGFTNNEDTINSLINNIRATQESGTTNLAIGWDFSTIIKTALLTYRTEITHPGGMILVDAPHVFETSPPAASPNTTEQTATFTNYPSNPSFRIRAFHPNGDLRYSIIIEDMADLNDPDRGIGFLKSLQKKKG